MTDAAGRKFAGLQAVINAEPGSREALEAEHGQVWDSIRWASISR